MVERLDLYMIVDHEKKISGLPDYTFVCAGEARMSEEVSRLMSEIEQIEVESGSTLWNPVVRFEIQILPLGENDFRPFQEILRWSGAWLLDGDMMERQR